MSDHEGETIDLAELCTSGTSFYSISDTLLAAITHAETLDRVTWITRQGKIVAAIAPDGFVHTETRTDQDIAARLDEILDIIRGEERCARCGEVALGYARGADGKRLCLGEARKCYSLVLFEESRDRLSEALRASMEGEFGQTAG